MAEPQLSVRSARAIELAHHLAQRHKQTVAEVVVRALEDLNARDDEREPASKFYRRISEEYGTDIDLEELIKEGRRPHAGIDL